VTSRLVNWGSGLAGVLAANIALAAVAAPPGPVVAPANTNTDVLPIDLPTALRLAGAQNLDVQIARQQREEAQANRESAVEQFFPWLSPGVTYHRRDGMAQAVPAGAISDTHFQSYMPGATVAAQLSLGEAIYSNLVARQLVHASDQGLETQRQDATLNAAQGYFDLTKAKALVGAATQALQTSQDYQRELRDAVASGIAFKGDELRVQTQTEHYRISLRQAEERQRVAAAELARVLHLDPAVELVPQDTGLSLLTLFGTNASQTVLVEQALRERPELKQSQALISAARAARNGAVYGPLIPSVGAQVFAGGLGGGPDGGPSRFGDSEDYLLGLSWRVGPGGLFDSGRIQASKARVATAQLSDAKLRDTVRFQVVAGLTRVRSLSDQIALAEQSLVSARETLRLTRERKQYGVGLVLEDIQAQQDLNRARADYVAAVAEFNKAQYGLSRAVGQAPQPAVPSDAR
jgi:outer membrane protein TolC